MIEAKGAEAQVQAIVKEAKKSSKRISVKGAGFSQGESFMPPTSHNGHIMIDMKRNNQIKMIDESKKIIKVGVGATWAVVQTFANEHKMAVKVMQASNVFSVGGSLGTNIHGCDHHNGTASNTIRSVTCVGPDGSIKTFSKNENFEEFRKAFGTFGLLNIVTSVELELTDNEMLFERAELVQPDEYAGWFAQHKNDPRIRMHLYRLSLKEAKLLQEGPRGTRLERIAINFARRSRFLQTNYWQYTKNQLLNPANAQAQQTTNEIMQPAINAMMNDSISESEWLQEYFVPATTLSSFLKRLGALLDANNVHLLNATVCFVKKGYHWVAALCT